MGALGLAFFSVHVTTPNPQPNGGIKMPYEVVSLWLHPALYDLANRPSESAAIQSQDAFQEYAERRGIRQAWYIVTLREFQANGKAVVTSSICRPYDMMPAYFFEFADIMAAASGHPPHYPNVDYSTAFVGVIPDRFLRTDPHQTLDELRKLEQQPKQAETP